MFSYRLAVTESMAFSDAKERKASRMVKQLSQEVGSTARPMSLHTALRRANAALRRLIKNYEREFALISLAAEAPPEVSKTLAEFQLSGFQFILLQVPLNQLTGLTVRQREIALSVAVGMSNKEVGNRLAISPATVASHLRVIYKKLNVERRSALLRRLLAAET